MDGQDDDDGKTSIEGGLVKVDLSDVLKESRKDAEKQQVPAQDVHEDDAPCKPEKGRRKNGRARPFFKKVLCYTMAAAAFYIGVNFNSIADYTADRYNNAVIAAKRETAGLAQRVLDYTGQDRQDAGHITGVPAAAMPSISGVYASLGAEERNRFLNDVINSMPAGREKDRLITGLMRQLSPETTARLGHNIALEMLAEFESNASSACAQTSIPYCNTLVNKYVLTQQNKNMILEIATIKASRVMRNLDRYVGRK